MYVLPGSPNVVPGRCEFSLEVRDASQDILDSLSDAYQELVRRVGQEARLQIDVVPISSIRATACSPTIINLVTQAAEHCGVSYTLMPSGAAHDAQNMAHIADIGMIFVPSINGVSHNPEEETNIEDIACGANVLYESLLRLGSS